MQGDCEDEMPHLATQNGTYRTTTIKSSTHPLHPGFHRPRAPITQRSSQISVISGEQETFTIRATMLSWPPSKKSIARASQGRRCLTTLRGRPTGTSLPLSLSVTVSIHPASSRELKSCTSIQDPQFGPPVEQIQNTRGPETQRTVVSLALISVVWAFHSSHSKSAPPRSRASLKSTSAFTTKADLYERSSTASTRWEAS